MNIPFKPLTFGAGLTIITLLGGLLLGGVLGMVIFESLNGHSLGDPNPVHVALSVIPIATGLIAGSGAWGWSMAQLARTNERRRLVLAGILGFAPISLLLGIVLVALEGIVSEGLQLPIHRVFTLLFVPAAFLIAGISSWAIGRGLKDNRFALSLLWQVGLAAAAAFLIVNLVMEASGWVVGAPFAAERTTMLTVMLSGNAAAALAGGAILGWRVTTWRETN
jgi:hypothetical protein